LPLHQKIGAPKIGSRALVKELAVKRHDSILVLLR
jgi:hypothetical protein